jgi:uncharacterized membrane-anchored protein YitT (DUF2179 family)
MTATVMADVFYTVMLASAVITVVYIFLISRVISVLQESHRDVYVEMGEPSLIANNNISNSMRLAWFLMSGNYRKLSDRKLSALSGACRALLFVAFCGYIYCFVILTYYWQVLRR